MPLHSSALHRSEARDRVAIFAETRPRTRGRASAGGRDHQLERRVVVQLTRGEAAQLVLKGAADADLAERLHRRNADLSEENARLASACNELAYRLVMTGVPVPPGLVDAAGHQPPRRAFPSVAASRGRSGSRTPRCRST